MVRPIRLESQLFSNDFGLIMGRIHASGRIPARGLTHDLEWFVVGNGIQNLSEIELEIWCGAQDRLSVSVKRWRDL